MTKAMAIWLHIPLSKKSGFSLIEAAIVLAIIGLVIGGIWIAAAKVTEERLITKTIADIILTVKNVQGLMSRSTADAIGDTYIHPTIRNAGGFPADWINGSVIRDPFGGVVTLRSIPNGINTARFDFTITAVPPAACLRLLAAISSHFPSHAFADNQAGGLMLMQVTQTSWSSYLFPYTPNGSECVSTGNTMVFTFAYTQM